MAAPLTSPPAQKKASATIRNCHAKDQDCGVVKVRALAVAAQSRVTLPSRLVKVTGGTSALQTVNVSRRQGATTTILQTPAPHMSLINMITYFLL